MEPNAFAAADAEEGEAVPVLQASEFALDGGTATVEGAPFVRASGDARVVPSGCDDVENLLLSLDAA